LIKYKIFSYELKRTIFSKSYAFLALLIGIYSVYILKTSVLRGFADTAPFSEWSFMYYLFSIIPFLLTILLFYISRLFSPYEKNVMRITSSMPFSSSLYFFIKLIVAAFTFLFAAFLAIIASFIFYGKVFNYFNFKIFITCIGLVLIPNLLLIQGLGIWVSRLQHNLTFALIGLVFLLSLNRFASSYYFDILGNSIMRIPLNTIPINGFISFAVPRDFYLSRIVLSIIGMILIICGCKEYTSMQMK
jgi:hypothetical protein